MIPVRPAPPELLYEQGKSKAPYQNNWKDMKREKQGQREKGFHPPSFINNTNTYQQGPKIP
jgi:hypothetical protein